MFCCQKNSPNIQKKSELRKTAQTGKVFKIIAVKSVTNL